MASDLIGFDTFTLKGEPVARAVSALRVARQQLRLAYGETESWRLEAVLADIDDELGAHLRKIEDAIDDDAAEAEACSESAARRQAWLPLQAA